MIFFLTDVEIITFDIYGTKEKWYILDVLGKSWYTLSVGVNRKMKSFVDNQMVCGFY